MAESAFLDDGSHLDHKIISADHIRRNEICWPVPAAASQHRTLSLTIIPGLPRWAINFVSSRTTRRPEIEVSGTAARHSRVLRDNQGENSATI